MATHTLSTRASRRSMLASGAASVAVLAGSSHISSGTPSPTPPPQAGEGLFVAPPTNAAPTLLTPPPLAGDVLLSVLAGEYRRALAALNDWIDLAEANNGPLAYDDPPYRARYDALCARADGLVAEIALVRPDSIFGLAVKLRAGVYYDYAGVVPLNCDERLLGPVLNDLDRMAEGALFGAA